MKQFVLPPWYAGQTRISLHGDDYRHLARVLRLREGAELPAIDVRGTRFVMRLSRVGRAGCDVELSPAEPPPPDAFGVPQITLLQCLPKGRKIDLIIRQATEAGVSRIVLLESERSIARASGDSGRLERLLKITREAAQQSGAERLPVLDGPRSLASLGGTAGQWGAALFFHEERLSAGTLHEMLADRPQGVSILIGPEGGLAPSEAEILRTAGFHPAYLGPGVLRVETAAIYAIAAVKTILQERDAWRAAQKE